MLFFFFSSRRRHTRSLCDWSSDVCSSDLASFAILLNFPRHNKMRGMGQVVSWSVRDETLHCEGIIRLFHTFAQETGALSQPVKDDIVECARTVVTLEDRFVDLAFEMGPVEGLTANEVKQYIR